MLIAFTVPSVPVAQPRQRHRVLHLGGRTIAQNYTPTKSPVNEFKATIKLACSAAYNGPPLEGPLRVDVVAVFPRPKSMTKKRGPNPRVPHTKKPDRDNLDKAVLDALKGLLFVDDCQAWCGEVTKWIAAGDEQPHVTIAVRNVESMSPPPARPERMF